MKKIGLLSLGLLAVAGVSTAQAQGLTMQMSNGWSFSFAGNVNAFYIFTANNANSAVDGGLAGLTDNNRSNYSTGLLPAFATFSAKGKEGNLDLGVHFGFAPQIQQGGVSSFFGDQAAGAQIDMRQVYLTFGGPWGQILAGKELGIYSRQNILTDMTLFGAGTAVPGARGTTLGRIGFGYQYTDFRAQIAYSSPADRPYQITIGITDPTVLSGDTDYDILETPRLEAEFVYNTKIGSDGNFKFFTSGLVQNAKTQVTTTTTNSVTAYGVAGGFQVGASGFTLTGSGYYSGGLGTTFLGSVGTGSGIGGTAIGADGEGRKAYGYVGQATFTPKGSKVTVGASFGESRLDRNDPAGTINDDPTTLVRSNRSYVGLISYQITKSLRWVGEFTRSESQNHVASSAKNTTNQGATGFMLFF